MFSYPLLYNTLSIQKLIRPTNKRLYLGPYCSSAVFEGQGGWAKRALALPGIAICTVRRNCRSSGSRNSATVAVTDPGPARPFSFFCLGYRAATYEMKLGLLCVEPPLEPLVSADSGWTKHYQLQTLSYKYSGKAEEPLQVFANWSWLHIFSYPKVFSS